MKESAGETIKSVLASESLSLSTMAVTLATGIGTWFDLIPSDVGRLAFIITFLIFIPVFIYRVLMIRREILLQKREVLEQLIISSQYKENNKADNKIVY